MMRAFSKHGSVRSASARTCVSLHFAMSIFRTWLDVRKAALSIKSLMYSVTSPGSHG
jgi:hypothetical protein